MFIQRDGELPYGEVQGIAPGGVVAYSNGSDRFFSGERSIVEGIVTGLKHQCVEFARRFLLQRKGLVIPDITFASSIFSMEQFKCATTGKDTRAVPVKNGGGAKPVADSLLIWESTPEYPPGHVAAIVEVGADYVRIADQNHVFTKWAGGYYSLQLKLEHSGADSDGNGGTWTILDQHGSKPLGWVTFPDTPNRDPDAPLVVDHKVFPPENYGAMVMDRVEFTPKQVEGPWLDVNNKAEKQFIDEFGVDLSRTRLAESKSNYYRINVETFFNCVKAGTQLHRLFVEATRKILFGQDTDLLAMFGIPEELWPLLRRSFERCPYQITGRFDFAVDAEGTQLKTFEYNADSASTLLECGRIQQKWAEAVGLAANEQSRSAGFWLPVLLEKVWSDLVHIKGIVPKGAKVHFFVDEDGEEKYTALYMMEFAEKAGLATQLVVGLDSLKRDPKTGVVFDADGSEVTYCWKTWNWESVISDWRRVKSGEQQRTKGAEQVFLSDIFLPADAEHAKAAFERMIVFEPMWKLIPGNKAILPVLWEMAPGHPNLLKTTWKLDDQLKASGYVKKPIVGRIGSNITVHGPNEDVPRAQSQGKYGDREYVYQELFPLPKRDDYYGILGGWIVGGYYGGTGVREDKGIITGVESPFSAVRVEYNLPLRGVTHKSLAAADEEKAAAAAAAAK